MDKIKIYPYEDCDECIMRPYEGYECLLDISKYKTDEERGDIWDPEVVLKPCLYRLTWDDTKLILRWFLETQKDKIEYIEK